MKSMTLFALSGLLCTTATAQALTGAPGDKPLTLAPMATGLEEPWGLAFLPDGSFLVTERAGRLTLYPPAGGAGSAVANIPAVFDQGQGGLLDVMVPRDFATSRHIYLTYAMPMSGGAGTALARGTLDADGQSLTNVTVLFQDPVPDASPVHFGSRVVEALDGTLFLTSGERGSGDLAQDVTRANGKVFHLSREGAPITAVVGALDGVHSLGHRNPQGAALDADGQFWLVEHGARGGDELNRVMAGANYGWPVITYGVNYNGDKIGIGTEAAGMEQPVHYWDPSIAPSGLMFYSGEMFPEWQGDVFVGSLKFDQIVRLDPDQGYQAQVLEGPETARVRDVRQGPDGAIWFLSVGNGAAYRIAR